MHILLKNKYLYFDNYKVKCAVGKRGIGVKKREGDQITPKGKFKIKCILYRKDRVPNLKTKLRKIIISKDMGWCDDPKSKLYNKLIKLPFKYSFETFPDPHAAGPYFVRRGSPGYLYRFCPRTRGQQGGRLTGRLGGIPCRRPPPRRIRLWDYSQDTVVRTSRKNIRP